MPRQRLAKPAYRATTVRDIVLALVLGFFVLWSLRAPWIGVLLWVVVSILNPHTYSWILLTMPVAAAVAGATMVGMAVSPDRKSFPITPETLLLLMMMAWFSVTLSTSMYYEDSFEQWKKVMKIDLMLLITLAVMHNRKHIVGLTWALVVSIGFYSVKGGLFTLATGGSYRVWGPEGTYIEGNNELALAVIITIPLMQFLRLNSTNIWIKRGLLFSMVVSAISALGSHSRGAVLALAAMAIVLWWRSKNKLVLGILMPVVGVLMIGFMPPEWFERMSSIGEYKEDGSAMGRINAWWMAWNLAKDNFFGGGFEIYTPANFARYAPDATDIHAAHSIYFQILGEHGFVGLTLYIALWTVTFVSAGKLRNVAARRPETQWLSDLGAMCQVSIAGFAVGGAFLSLAYFDLSYNIMVLVVIARRWIREEAWRNEPAAVMSGEAEAAAKPSSLVRRVRSHLVGGPPLPKPKH